MKCVLLSLCMKNASNASSANKPGFTINTRGAGGTQHKYVAYKYLIPEVKTLVVHCKPYGTPSVYAIITTKHILLLLQSRN